MHERDVMPEPREMASEGMIAKARARGEMHGFKDEFLDCFIERELQLMWKWQNRQLSSGH